MTDAHLASQPAAPEEDITTSLYRAAIGPVGADYYVPIFTRFEDNDRAGITWNTVAALFTLHWLLFRQLYLYALAYVAAVLTVVLLVFGIGRVLFQFPPSLLIALGVGFGAMAVALPGLFGNALLHTEIRKRMAAAVAANHNMADARATLLARASKRRHGIALAGVQALLAVVGALVVWQFAAHTPDAPVVSETPPPALPVTQPLSAGSIGRIGTSSAPLPDPIAVAASTPASATTSTAPLAPSSAAVPAGVPASTPTSAPVTMGASAPANAASTVASATVSAPAPRASIPASAPASTAPTARTSAPSAARAVASAPTAAASHAPKAAPAPRTATAKPSTPAARSKAPASATTPKAKSTAAPASKAAAPKKPYYINVGLFAVAENAERVQAKLKTAQLAVVATELKGKNGPLTRVRVGPYSSAAEAQAAAAKIKALQLDAVVVQP